MVFGARTMLLGIAEYGLPNGVESDWSRRALGLLETDQHRTADTHLLYFDVPALEGISIYLKDESTHPTGSLKHRLARSLFLLGICNGNIRRDTPIVEASSGSTAVSEAYFARLLGLPFHAVMPATTSPEKIAAIEHQGGYCHLIANGRAIYDEAAKLTERLGGVYLDQFTFAERATDWRQQQHRRIDFPADECGAARGAVLDRDECRDRRNDGDDRPLHPLSQLRDQALRRRYRTFGVLRFLQQARSDHHLRSAFLY